MDPVQPDPTPPPDVRLRTDPDRRARRLVRIEDHLSTAARSLETALEVDDRDLIGLGLPPAQLQDAANYARRVLTALDAAIAKLDPSRTPAVDPALATFAARVRAAIAAIGTAPHERFGAGKVFISAILAVLTVEMVGARSDFDRALLACNRAGLLSLARADLVAAMPADVVAASEITDRGSSFHFVIDPSAREPWEVA